jgi:hypothetical protein
MQDFVVSDTTGVLLSHAAATNAANYVLIYMLIDIIL